MMDYYETNSCDRYYEVRKVRIMHHNGVDVLALCAKCAPKSHRQYLPTGRPALKRKNSVISSKTVV